MKSSLILPYNIQNNKRYPCNKYHIIPLYHAIYRTPYYHIIPEGWCTSVRCPRLLKTPGIILGMQLVNVCKLRRVYLHMLLFQLWQNQYALDSYVLLPSSVPVGQFSASSIENWNQSNNHCETIPTPPRQVYLSLPRKLKFGTEALFDKTRSASHQLVFQKYHGQLGFLFFGVISAISSQILVV